MRTCLDCLHCKVKLPLAWRDDEKIAELLYEQAKVYCAKNQWRVTVGYAVHTSYKTKTKRVTKIKYVDERAKEIKVLRKANTCPYFEEA